jgi:phosphoglycolate phosphatase-like HAD superfamily hydrolase
MILTKLIIKFGRNLHNLSMEYDNYNYFFWDFDGVIKESVNIKTKAFEKLFELAPQHVLDKISKHHIENGGMSRFEKIPLYMKFSGIKFSEKCLEDKINLFSSIVIDKVIKSEWVPGAKETLEKYFDKKSFYLITGTPKNEIDYILRSLDIEHYFKKVVGAPIKKNIAVKNIIKEENIPTNQAIFIGDATSDYEAAELNDIEFLLRIHEWNVNLKNKLICKKIKNFL